MWYVGVAVAGVALCGCLVGDLRLLRSWMSLVVILVAELGWWAIVGVCWYWLVMRWCLL